MRRNPLRVLYLSVAVILVDQATKLLVKGFSLPILNIHHTGMHIGSSVPLLGSALRLTYIENPGMAFGIQVGSQLVLALLSFAASAGIFYYLLKVRDQALVVRISLAMVLGGAIGNLIDRMFYGILYGEAPLFYGKVVDFIDVNFLHLSRFGIFNIADAAVTCGVVLLLVFHRALDPIGEPSAATTESVSPSGEDNEHGQRKLTVTDSRTELQNINR